MGAFEFINNKTRYCFWFPEQVPVDLRKAKELVERLILVQKMRMESTDPKTREFFHVDDMVPEIIVPDLKDCKVYFKY